MTAANENVTENGEESYKAPLGLKLLVIGLGIAIVLMLGLIIVKVIAGDHKKPKSDPAVLPSTVEAGVTPAANATIVSYFNEIVQRPEGSELVSVAVTGTEVTLQFSSSEADTIVVFDRASKKESRLTIPK